MLGRGPEFFASEVESNTVILQSCITDFISKESDNLSKEQVIILTQARHNLNNVMRTLRESANLVGVAMELKKG